MAAAVSHAAAAADSEQPVLPLARVFPNGQVDSDSIFPGSTPACLRVGCKLATGRDTEGHGASTRAGLGPQPTNLLRSHDGLVAFKLCAGEA